MSRYISYLIDDVRQSTENTDFSETIGIKDAEFLRFLNDAQYRIQNLITQQHPSIFLTEYTTPVVGNQESYSLPNKAYMGNKVTQVEYTYNTSGVKYYYPLRPGSLFERSSGPGYSGVGAPIKYIRRAGKILLVPIPTSTNGHLRITYTHKIPKLDLKRGSVASVTLTSNSISSLTLDVSTDAVDSTTLNKFTRVSIVDEEGNVNMSNIKVTNVDGATGIVTVDPAFTFDEGETINVGDIIVAGEYSSTHSNLDDMVERYLIAYTTFKIYQRDSNVTDLQAQQNVLLEMESEIVAAYSEISDDIMEIPDIISEDDEWSF
jgi:hypothetical protein